MRLRETVVVVCGYLLTLAIAFALLVLMFVFVRPSPTSFRPVRTMGAVPDVWARSQTGRSALRSVSESEARRPMDP